MKKLESAYISFDGDPFMGLQPYSVRATWKLTNNIVQEYKEGFWTLKEAYAKFKDIVEGKEYPTEN